MSDDQAKKDQGAGQPANAGTGKEKRRSPVERAIVWGAILVLGVIALWQGWAWLGYSRTLGAWEEKKQAADEDPDAGPFTLAEAEELITGFPQKEQSGLKGLNRRVTYTWCGPFAFQNYRVTLDVSDDGAGSILNVSTPKTIQPPGALGETGGDDSKDGGSEKGGSEGGGAGGPPAGMGGGGPGGMMGGGDLVEQMMDQLDRDGNDRISPEEALGGVNDHFDRFDKDGDGLLVKDELAALQEYLQENGGPNGSPSGSAAGPENAPAEETGEPGAADPRPAQAPVRPAETPAESDSPAAEGETGTESDSDDGTETGSS